MPIAMILPLHSVLLPIRPSTFRTPSFLHSLSRLALFSNPTQSRVDLSGLTLARAIGTSRYTISASIMRGPLHSCAERLVMKSYRFTPTMARSRIAQCMVIYVRTHSHYYPDSWLLTYLLHLSPASSTPSSSPKKKKKGSAAASASPSKPNPLDNMRRANARKSIPVSNSPALPIGTQS